jgi:hypothetical protein
MRHHSEGGERAKVGEHELDLSCEAVQRGVVAREGETHGLQSSEPFHPTGASIQTLPNW